MTNLPDEMIIVTAAGGLTVAILAATIIGTSERGGTGAVTTVMNSGVKGPVTTTTRSIRSKGSLVVATIRRITTKPSKVHASS